MLFVVAVSAFVDIDSAVIALVVAVLIVVVVIAVLALFVAVKQLVLEIVVIEIVVVVVMFEPVEERFVATVETVVISVVLPCDYSAL